jgi:hypothetical protein
MSSYFNHPQVAFLIDRSLPEKPILFVGARWRQKEESEWTFNKVKPRSSDNLRLLAWALIEWKLNSSLKVARDPGSSLSNCLESWYEPSARSGIKRQISCLNATPKSNESIPSGKKSTRGYKRRIKVIHNEDDILAAIYSKDASVFELKREIRPLIGDIVLFFDAKIKGISPIEDAWDHQNSTKCVVSQFTLNPIPASELNELQAIYSGIERFTEECPFKSADYSISRTLEAPINQLIKSDSNGICLITGKPGSGKTGLMVCLLENHFRFLDGFVTASFFFQRGRATSSVSCSAAN